jgi:hypothetical protein
VLEFELYAVTHVELANRAVRPPRFTLGSKSRSVVADIISADLDDDSGLPRRGRSASQDD